MHAARLLASCSFRSHSAASHGTRYRKNGLTKRQSRNVQRNSSRYKYPWPFIIDVPNPTESGDPRLQNEVFKNALGQAYQEHVAKEDAELEEKEQFQQRLREIEDTFKGFSATLDDQMKEHIAAEKARPHSWELTPEIRRIAHEFSMTWHEFCSLEKVALGFSSTNLSLDALKPYQLAEPGKYDFKKLHPDALGPDASGRVRMMEDNLLHWYKNRSTEVSIPDDQFNTALNAMASSTQISGDWMTAYAIELGNPGSAARDIFGRLASIDAELYKAREHLAQIAEVAEVEDTQRVLLSTTSMDERAQWYKEHQTRRRAIADAVSKTFLPETIALFKSTSERQDIRDAVAPAFQPSPFPIYGKGMQDDPLETAIFALAGDFIRRQKSDDELKALETVETFEDLIKFHALHREASSKLLSKPEAEQLLAGRETLKLAVSEKLERLKQLGMELELFSKYPYLVRCLNLAALNWLLHVDFAFWHALPHKLADKQRINAHMAEAFLHSRLAMRKAYSILSAPEFGGADVSYIPKDHPSETPYGLTPLEHYIKDPPSGYTDPSTGKWKHLGKFAPVEPYPTEEYKRGVEQLATLLAQENRRKRIFFIALLLAAVAAILLYIEEQRRLARVWQDGDVRYTRLALQKVMAIFTLFDHLMFYISFPFDSVGQGALKGVGRLFFAVFDKPEEVYRHAREDAVAILLKKRQIDAFLFKDYVTRPSLPEEISRIESAQSHILRYSFQHRVKARLAPVPRVISSEIDEFVFPVRAAEVKIIQAASQVVPTLSAQYSAATLYFFTRLNSLRNQYPFLKL